MVAGRGAGMELQLQSPFQSAGFLCQPEAPRLGPRSLWKRAPVLGGREGGREGEALMISYSTT